jgi:putative membrane protein
VLTALGIHLIFAVSSLVLLVWVLWEAAKRFPTPPEPCAHSRRHMMMARLAGIDLVLTAITGSVFYWLAFVAR